LLTRILLRAFVSVVFRGSHVKLKAILLTEYATFAASAREQGVGFSRQKIHNMYAYNRVSVVTALRLEDPASQQSFHYAPSLAATMSASQHMSDAEVARLDLMQKKGCGAAQILKKLQQARQKKGGSGPSPSAVYRRMAGETYAKGRMDDTDTRGRSSTMPPNACKIASQQLTMLHKAADNEYLVTWSDVHKATKAKLHAQGVLKKKGVKMPCPEVLAKAVRASTDVRARPGKQRIALFPEHVRKRFTLVKKWIKYPKKFWQKDIHGYIDTKKFVCPRNAKEKKLMRSSKVHHHLRTPTEGKKDMYLLPKGGRNLTGIPSVEITACVAKDRIIMWHESEKPWNGNQGATMYKALGAALRKFHGRRASYRVVEDGDPKGFQSNKGIQAKKEQKIRSWKLSPRSPGLMLLDYSLWNEIEHRVLAKKGPANESMQAYKKRLNLTAKKLPRGQVKKTLLKMKDNIAAILKSKGRHGTPHGGDD
jgi:hypothetical protein